MSVVTGVRHKRAIIRRRSTSTPPIREQSPSYAGLEYKPIQAHTSPLRQTTTAQDGHAHGTRNIRCKTRVQSALLGRLRSVTLHYT